MPDIPNLMNMPRIRECRWKSEGTISFLYEIDSDTTLLTFFDHKQLHPKVVAGAGLINFCSISEWLAWILSEVETAQPINIGMNR